MLIRVYRIRMQVLYEHEHPCDKVYSSIDWTPNYFSQQTNTLHVALLVFCQIDTCYEDIPPPCSHVRAGDYILFSCLLNTSDTRSTVRALDVSKRCL